MRQSAEGGLAIDAAGQAIGMTVFGPRRRVLVIPSATIERVATRLEKHGHIPRGYLGLGFQLVAARSLLRALGPDSVGQTVTLGLRRGGEAKDVPLTIAERPTA